MKIAIKANETDLSQKVKKRLLMLFEHYSIDHDDEHPDIVISIGGDGTLLSACHEYLNQLKTIKFIAIHTGHLGFYTDFIVAELDHLLDCLIQEEQLTYSYPLLEVNVHEPVQTIKALNEMTLKTISGTLVCEVYIGDDLFEVFRGDGLCVSTPTGSTGISKSLGGALVHPKVEAMQLVELAPLNNRVYRTIGSPLILPKTEKITLKIVQASSPYIVIDNLDPIYLDMTSKQVIDITIAKDRIYFADYKKNKFWSRIENSFIGEIKLNDMPYQQDDEYI